MQVSVQNQHAKVIVDVAIQMEKAVNDMKSQFSKLNVGSELSKEFQSAFKGITGNLSKIMDLGGKKQLSTTEIEQLVSLFKTVDGQFTTLDKRFEELGLAGAKNLEKISPQFAKLTKFIIDTEKATVKYTQSFNDLTKKQSENQSVLEEQRAKYKDLAQAIEEQEKQQNEYKQQQQSKQSNTSDLKAKKADQTKQLSDTDSKLKPFEKINAQLALIKVNGKEAGTSLTEILAKARGNHTSFADAWQKSFTALENTIEDVEKRIEELKKKKAEKGLNNKETSELNFLEGQLKTLNTGKKQAGAFNPNESKNGILVQYEQLKQQQQDLQQKIQETTAAIQQQNQEMGNSSGTELKEKLAQLKKEQKDTQTEITKLEQEQKKLQESFANLKQPDISSLRKQFSDLTGVPLEEVPNDLDQILKKQQELAGAAPTQFVQMIEQLRTKQSQQGQQGAGFFKRFANQLRDSGAAAKQTNDELEMFKSRIKYFFSAYSAVQLFKRVLQQTFQTVKELDSAMTEIAVVTNFSVGDMWDQLPKYTDEANKLGVAIKSMYESTQLFYQQGLRTNQVFELAEETMKMARIAGLSQTDQTDRMTNQLRGFNMELDQTSAQKVSDVYSKLAQISASNVNELSVAMTKTASIANTAGASFENTAAFIAQIVKSATYNSNVA